MRMKIEFRELVSWLRERRDFPPQCAPAFAALIAHYGLHLDASEEDLDRQKLYTAMLNMEPQASHAGADHYQDVPERELAALGKEFGFDWPVVLFRESQPGHRLEPSTKVPLPATIKGKLRPWQEKLIRDHIAEPYVTLVTHSIRLTDAPASKQPHNLNEDRLLKILSLAILQASGLNSLAAANVAAPILDVVRGKVRPGGVPHEDSPLTVYREASRARNKLLEFLRKNGQVEFEPRFVFAAYEDLASRRDQNERVLWHKNLQDSDYL